MNKAINLTMFANLEDVMAQHTDVFTEGNDFGERFGSIRDQLGQLGYDLLINSRQNAEFAPTSRLSEVISQRDGFKTQAENAIKELNELKAKQGVTPEMQSQIDGLIQANEQLIDSLVEANMNLDIVTAAADAKNPKDILVLINKESLTIDKKTGKVTKGLEEELGRLRTEKPYLFNEKETSKAKAGAESNGSGSGSGGDKVDMNAMIRRSAHGRSF